MSNALSLYSVGDEAQLSLPARMSLGVEGLTRLGRFRELQDGWDQRGAKALNADSVTAFSDFFRDTALQPADMGVFMSHAGNVVVSWTVTGLGLVELEFRSDRIDYFFDWNEEEGWVPRDDVGVSRLFGKLEALSTDGQG